MLVYTKHPGIIREYSRQSVEPSVYLSACVDMCLYFNQWNINLINFDINNSDSWSKKYRVFVATKIFAEISAMNVPRAVISSTHNLCFVLRDWRYPKIN